MQKNQVRIGIGVLIFRDNQILLCKRKNAHGEGCWAPPGGHLEFEESLEQCAIREVLEETGLQICDLQPGPYTNDIFYVEQKHYVTIFMKAKYNSGEPEVLEPNKCQEWQWFDIDKLPTPLFKSLENLIKDKKDLKF